MNVLVTGSNGQLGSEIKAISTYYKDFYFFFTDLKELDITDSSQVIHFIKKNKVDCVINCAAYTKVEESEKNPKIAEKINSEGVLNIANAIKSVNGKLIHISTDYVFDGKKFSPYNESDTTNPIGIYGKTKRNGELNILDSDIDSIIIRTSWLYSVFGNNFVKNIMKFGLKNDELEIVFDQIGTPTSAADLAKVCLEILAISKSDNISKRGKIYHFSNEGVTSWYDFAKQILEISGILCKIKPIESNQYAALVDRPPFSVLNKAKIKADFGFEIPHWSDSLKTCINKLNKNI